MQTTNQKAAPVSTWLTRARFARLTSDTPPKVSTSGPLVRLASSRSSRSRRAQIDSWPPGSSGLLTLGR